MAKIPALHELDATDLRILALLQEDATLTVAEVADKVSLSPTPCWRRIQRLEKDGVIRKRVTLLDAARLGRDVGALDTLKRYERWRRFDSVVMGGTMDALNRLFSNDIAPLRHLRDLGLGIVDSIGPARRFFMRHAGGDVGQLPKLMKGEAA